MMQEIKFRSMAWTDKEEQSWFQQWWLRRYPQEDSLDAVHERKARFRGFWGKNSRLFPRYESKGGLRLLTNHQINASEAWFDEHDILTACPVPERRGLTPLAGTTEVDVKRHEGQAVIFTQQQTDQINAESTREFGRKMRQFLGVPSFRRLHQGDVRRSEADELGS